MNTVLASVYHKNLLDSTIFQQHWAGRSSRGVAQYNGSVINRMLQEEHFVNLIEDNGENEEKSDILASALGRFTAYGYKEKAERCLFLLKQNITLHLKHTITLHNN